MPRLEIMTCAGINEKVDHTSIDTAVCQVPEGKWVVGVSGGADSVALLRMLACRNDLQLHVVHFNHETRPGENEAEARFVESLCGRMNISCRVGRMSQVELPATQVNRSARYRLARMRFFRETVVSTGAQGVALAHHADDQAETVLRRLLRGADPAALAGIRAMSQVEGLRVHHPLLNCRRFELRAWLRECGQNWCEDSSNQSDRYERNRLRKVLLDDEMLVRNLLDISRAATAYGDWLSRAVPKVEGELPMALVAELPEPVARHYIRDWLLQLGCPANDIDSDTLGRVKEMAIDQSSPPGMHVAGGIPLRRRKGKIVRE